MKTRDVLKKIRRGIKYPLLVFLIHCFIFIIGLFPRKFNLRVYRRLALVAYRFSPKLRNFVKKQLRFAYGDSLSEAQVSHLAQGVYVNQAWHFTDYVYSIRFKKPEQFARFIDFRDIDILKREYDKGKGVICLFSHCGPWELAVLMPPVLGFATTALSRSLPNPRLNNIIVQFREARGMKNVTRNGKAYPTLIEAINRGECLIIMIDQDTKVKGVYIDFYGKTAFTPIGAARLALDTQASVVPIQMKRLPNMRYEFRPLEPIPTIRTGNREDDLLQNTINYTRSVEQIIRQTPEQWVWMHDRWHTTPEIEKAWLEQHQKNKLIAAQRQQQLLMMQDLKRQRRTKFLKSLQFWKFFMPAK